MNEKMCLAHSKRYRFSLRAQNVDWFTGTRDVVYSRNLIGSGCLFWFYRVSKNAKMRYNGGADAERMVLNGPNKTHS